MAVVTTGVRYLQAYSDANPPVAGHEAWAVQNGPGTFLVLGRHYVPTGAVGLT